MASICLYLQMHQPYRVKPYQVFDVGSDHDYFHHQESPSSNKHILQRVARDCYIPTLQALREMAEKHSNFAVSLSLTGLIIEQFMEYEPDVIDLLRDLAAFDNVEFLAETYYHSLASLYSQQEFIRQVQLHELRIQELFGKHPTAFRNTELIYDNSLAALVEHLGYQVMLAEGADHVLEWRSPDYVYKAAGTENMRLLLKNYRLSDDIAFRFSDSSKKGMPLTAETYARWLSQVNGNGYVINLFMDMETFGEHHKSDTGIFQFLKALPEAVAQETDLDFKTITQAALTYPPSDVIDVSHPTSWADITRDVSAWTDNAMQRSALQTIFSLEQDIIDSDRYDLIHDWRKLQTSDHFYYMSTKLFNDGQVHAYFSPFETPYDAFTAFMNVVHDLRFRLKKTQSTKHSPTRVL